MVATASRSPITPLSIPITSKLFPSDQSHPTNINLLIPYSKRRHSSSTPLFASFKCEKKNQRAQAIQLQTLGKEELPNESNSKDSHYSLPRPVKSMNLSNLPSSRGSALRVAYQGVPGAFSESAAGKAYPNCEPVPCEQFDTAFEAVEGWLVDRAVLPIENSLGGSIFQ